MNKYKFDSFNDYVKHFSLEKEVGSCKLKLVKNIFLLARSSENLTIKEISELLGAPENDVWLESVYKMALAPKTKTKAKKNELILVCNGEDWEALYLDGKKVESGHSISRDTISEYSVKYKTKIVKKFTTNEYNLYSQDSGDFHDDLSDVKLEK